MQHWRSTATCAAAVTYIHKLQTSQESLDKWCKTEKDQRRKKSYSSSAFKLQITQCLFGATALAQFSTKTEEWFLEVCNTYRLTVTSIEGLYKAIQQQLASYQFTTKIAEQVWHSFCFHELAIALSKFTEIFIIQLASIFRLHWLHQDNHLLVSQSSVEWFEGSSVPWFISQETRLPRLLFRSVPLRSVEYTPPRTGPLFPVHFHTLHSCKYLPLWKLFSSKGWAVSK